MIEFILVAAFIAACILTPVVLLAQLIRRSPRYMRMDRRLRDPPYGVICGRCYHQIDLGDRASCRAYDAGQCPSCHAPLPRLR